MAREVCKTLHKIQQMWKAVTFFFNCHHAIREFYLLKTRPCVLSRHISKLNQHQYHKLTENQNKSRGINFDGTRVNANPLYSQTCLCIPCNPHHRFLHHAQISFDIHAHSSDLPLFLRSTHRQKRMMKLTDHASSGR